MQRLRMTRIFFKHVLYYERNILRYATSLVLASRILIESWKWKRHTIPIVWLASRAMTIAFSLHTHPHTQTHSTYIYRNKRVLETVHFPMETFASTRCAGSISVLRVEQFSSQRKPTESGDKMSRRENSLGRTIDRAPLLQRFAEEERKKKIVQFPATGAAFLSLSPSFSFDHRFSPTHSK